MRAYVRGGRRVPREAGRSGGDLRRVGPVLPGDEPRGDLEAPPDVLVRQMERAVLNWVRGYSRLLADYVEAVMGEAKMDGGQRWHEDIAIVKRDRELRYVWLLRGRGSQGRPVLLAARYARDRSEGHAVALLKAAWARARGLPERIVSDGEWSFERAYQRVLGLRHRDVRMVYGVPIACRRHGLEHNNNPAEQMVRELKDWHRHMNGFASDRSAADLLRGWFVHVNVVNTHGRSRTRAERAGQRLGLPQEGRIWRLIEQAVEWRRSRLSSVNRKLHGLPRRQCAKSSDARRSPSGTAYRLMSQTQIRNRKGRAASAREGIRSNRRGFHFASNPGARRAVRGPRQSALSASGGRRPGGSAYQPTPRTAGSRGRGASGKWVSRNGGLLATQQGACAECASRTLRALLGNTVAGGTLLGTARSAKKSHALVGSRTESSALTADVLRPSGRRILK